MNHIVEINDKTEQGKALLALIRSFPQNVVSVVDEDTISVENFFSELRKEVKKQFLSKKNSK